MLTTLICPSPPAFLSRITISTSRPRRVSRLHSFSSEKPLSFPRWIRETFGCVMPKTAAASVWDR